MRATNAPVIEALADKTIGPSDTCRENAWGRRSPARRKKHASHCNQQQRHRDAADGRCAQKLSADRRNLGQRPGQQPIGQHHIGDVRPGQELLHLPPGQSQRRQAEPHVLAAEAPASLAAGDRASPRWRPCSKPSGDPRQPARCRDPDADQTRPLRRDPAACQHGGVTLHVAPMGGISRSRSCSRNCSCQGGRWRDLMHSGTSATAARTDRPACKF